MEVHTDWRCGLYLSVYSGMAHNPFASSAFLLLKYSHILGSKNIRSMLKEASATDTVLKKVIQSKRKVYNRAAKRSRDRDRDRGRSASRSPRRSRSRGRSRSRSPRRPSGKNNHKNYKSSNSGYKYRKGKGSGGSGGSSYKKSKPDKSKD